jgi:hypothetical protein
VREGVNGAETERPEHVFRLETNDEQRIQIEVDGTAHLFRGEQKYDFGRRTSTAGQCVGMLSVGAEMLKTS